MKAHLTKLVALLFLLGVMGVRSQTLNWASLTGSTIVDHQGDALNNTFLFQLGSFDVGFVPTQANIGQWTAKWHTFDTAAYSYDATSQTSYFTSTVPNIQDVPAYSSMFEGLQAYIWVQNSSKTEYFLAGASNWTFPVQDPTCCPNGTPTSWSVSDLGTDTPIWGGQSDKQGGGTYTTNQSYDLQTHVVPEPNSFLLALLGGGFALLRRRRRPGPHAASLINSVLLGSGLAVSGVQAKTINWYCPQKSNLTSTGQNMDSGFQFQLGVFTGGFIPSASNMTDWLSHWAPAQVASYNSATKAFDTNFTVLTNTTPFTVGAKAYIWGRRIGATGDEWILFSKSDWTWPAPDPTSPTSVFWSTAAANQVVLGNVVAAGDPFLMKSEAICSFTQWQNAQSASLAPNGNTLNPSFSDFVFGIQPGSGATPVTPTALVSVAGQQFLQISIPRVRNHLATVSVEVSDDLQTWTSGDSYTTEVENTATALIVRDQSTIDPTRPSRFMRVKAVVDP